MTISDTMTETSGRRPSLEMLFVRSCDVISALLLAGLMGLLVFSILSRDLIQVAIPWLEEIATLATIYAVAFASIGAWSRNAHIAIEMLPLAIPASTRHYYLSLLQVLSIIFLLLAAYGALEMAQRSSNNLTTALGISFSFYYGGLLLAFGGMAISATMRLLAPDRPAETGPAQGQDKC